MPLHLLPKKSWNVYNQANIARVKRDEAQAAERAAKEEEAQQAADARRRMKILRGESPSPAPSPTPSTSHAAGGAQQNAEKPGSEPTSGGPRGITEDDRGVASDLRSSRQQQREELLGRDLTYSDRDRTRKRRRGEDDTDRDMRYARQRLDRAGVSTRLGGEDEDAIERDGNLRDPSNGNRQRDSSSQMGRRKDRDRDAPLVDERGNISLFPAAAAADLEASQGRSDASRRPQNSSDGRNPHLGRDSRSKPDTRANAYDGTMRFADAAAGSSGSAFHQLLSGSGRGGVYSADSENGGDRSLRDGGDGRSPYGHNVFGNEDPKRQGRDAARLAAADPLAAIQRGVRQVRQVERERKKWADERRSEVEELRREERERDKERRRRRQDDGYEDRTERDGRRPDGKRRDERMRARRGEDDDVDDLDLGEAIRDDGDRKSQSEDERQRRRQQQRRDHRYHENGERENSRERHRHRHGRHSEDTRRDKDRDRERHGHRSDRKNKREHENSGQHHKHRKGPPTSRGTLLSYDLP